MDIKSSKNIIWKARFRGFYNSWIIRIIVPTCSIFDNIQSPIYLAFYEIQNQIFVKSHEAKVFFTLNCLICNFLSFLTVKQGPDVLTMICLQNLFNICLKDFEYYFVNKRILSDTFSREKKFVYYAKAIFKGIYILLKNFHALFYFWFYTHCGSVWLQVLQEIP